MKSYFTMDLGKLTVLRKCLASIAFSLLINVIVCLKYICVGVFVDIIGA